jgi:hypothetical protein
MPNPLRLMTLLSVTAVLTITLSWHWAILGGGIAAMAIIGGLLKKVRNPRRLGSGLKIASGSCFTAMVLLRVLFGKGLLPLLLFLGFIVLFVLSEAVFPTRIDPPKKQGSN